MNFRQRVAWLLLAIYLVSTASAVYYMFEISTRLRMFALDHVDRLHTVAASPLRPSLQHNSKPTVETAPALVAACLTFLSSTLAHVVDVPVPVLVVVVFIAYVQIFCVLWMYTRPEAHCLSSCFWPVRLYSVLKSRSARSVKSPQDRKNLPSAFVTNGTRTTVTCEL